LNIEDSDYFNADQAAKIRAIVLNSYPYISLDEMKSNLKSAGFSYADELTRGDIITAVQFAIWRYSNADYKHIEGIDKYGETTNNTNLSYARPYHDYTNELWHWWANGKNATYYDATMEVKINALVEYLCARTPIYAGDQNRIVTDIELVQAETSRNSNGKWNVALTVEINGTINSGDNVQIVVKDANGELASINAVAGQTVYNINFVTDNLNEITVTASGTQNMATDAYLYMPFGGKEVSQVLVGMSSGETTVFAEMTLYSES
jgi:TQXA domain-containing protein